MEEFSIEASNGLSFGLIRPILRDAENSGVDIGRILGGYDIPAQVDEVPDTYNISLTTYFRIERDIAKGLDDLTAQLSERKLTYDTGQFIVAQISSARTLEEAIRRLATHFNMMHGGNYNSIKLTQNSLNLEIDDAGFPYRHRTDEDLVRFIADTVLIRAHCILDNLTGGLADQALRSVSLVRTKPDNLESGHLGFWAVPIRYSRDRYILSYDYVTCQSAVDVPPGLDLSSAGLYSRIIERLENDQRTGGAPNLRLRVMDLIHAGIDRQADVASHLGISVATLRRRLAALNIGFRDILLDTRLERAKQMLASGMSVSEVAEETGYSDVRALNRAFRNRVGKTPAAFADALQS